MNVTDDMRDAAYATASTIQKTLYSSPDQGVRLHSIFTRHSLPEELYGDYAISVGDVILGFYKPSDLPTLFETTLHLDSLTALRLAADLADFLAPLSSKQTEGAASLGSSIAETEAALQKISPNHTMASDAQIIRERNGSDEPPIYQSTQPSLRPGSPLRGPSAPTWED